MSTLERTISMMKELPETDLLQIQDLIRKLFRDHEFEIVDHAVGNASKPLLRKDFMEEIEAAEREIEGCDCRQAEEVFAELEKRYGF